jgi:nicotinamidase-related amidase
MKYVWLSLLVTGAAMLPATALTSEPKVHPTLRALSGTPTPVRLNPRKTALLLIDFQNEYFDGKLALPDARKALEQGRKLLEFADWNGMSVAHVLHVNPTEAPIFAQDSKGARVVDDIRPDERHVVLHRHTVSIFAGTELNARLKEAGVETIIIAGLMTHASVATAAREAALLGYEVIVASDAVATRSVDAWDRDGMIPHDVLNRAALAGISDAFGSVMPSDAILSLLVEDNRPGQGSIQ